MAVLALRERRCLAAYAGRRLNGGCVLGGERRLQLYTFSRAAHRVLSSPGACGERRTAAGG